MTYYIGTSPTDVIGSFIKRYFYGLRRNDDGEENIVVINDLGVAAESYQDFEEGIDFLSGVDENHEIVYNNLRYPQFKWDNRSLTYFIDPADGQFIQRLSEKYVYPANISSPAYGEGDDSQVITTNTPVSGGY